MQKVFIIHGLQSSPNSAWKPYLMRECAKKNIWACSLTMTDEKEPNCDEWVRIIDSHVKKEDEVVLVGHSLGVRAILRYLEREETLSIVGAVLVSGRFGRLENGEMDSFYKKPLNTQRIVKRAPRRVVIHGDDDPVVPYADGLLLSGALSCELITIGGGGHLGSRAGCFELPEVRDVVYRFLRAE